MDKIEEFINKFRTPETEKVFTQGGCYWFAHILYTRFSMTLMKPEIWYNEVSDHFATMIGDKLYDITGKLKRTGNKWIKWDEYRTIEPSYSDVVIRDCILKV